MTIKRICAGLAALGLLLAASGQASDSAKDAARPPLTRPDDPAVSIVMLVDLSSGAVLAERNANRRFVPASITKAMTLFVAFELMQQGKLDPETRFAISDETFKAWSQQGSTMYLAAGSQTRVDDLLMGIANVSANDGAIVLAEGAAGSVPQWVALMNRTAHELGMRNTRFGTPNGWPDEGGTFTTAADLVILARAMVTRHPGRYARYVGKPGFAYNGIAQNNHDPLAGSVVGADGIKTGFTNQAGHGFLGSAERDGRRLALVVAGSPTEPARDALARSLIEWGFSATDSRALLTKGGQLGSASVQGGDALSVPLIAAMPVRATVPHGKDPKLALSVRYLGPLRAPIRKGETVAELEIAAAGMAPSYVPLVAGADVARAEGLTRLRNGLVGLLRW